MVMKEGYYCRMYGKDCFIVTNAQKRTEKLAEEFINKVQNAINRFYNISEANIEYVKKTMLPAVMEVKRLKNGLEYIDIHGRYGEFGGYGCDPCENPFEVCVIV